MFQRWLQSHLFHEFLFKKLFLNKKEEVKKFKSAASVESHGNFVMIYDMIYLLTPIWLTPGGSSTVHIYTQYTEQHN
jgi:hypothetical protein